MSSRYRLHFQTADKTVRAFECTASSPEAARELLRARPNFSKFIAGGLYKINEVGAVIG